MVTNPQYTKGVDITKSDTVDFKNEGTSDRLCSAIYVGGAGVVAVVFQDGSVLNFTAVAGGYLYVKARRVNLTNTTASLMIALYDV